MLSIQLANYSNLIGAGASVLLAGIFVMWVVDVRRLNNGRSLNRNRAMRSTGEQLVVRVSKIAAPVGALDKIKREVADSLKKSGEGNGVKQATETASARILARSGP